MNNPMLNAMINTYQRYRSNPMEAVRGTYNIPDDIDTSDPDPIVQYLIKTNQVSPQQIQRINSLQNNPLIMKLLGMRF